MAKRAVIYARISVTAEASVSIDRQLAAAEKYAEARGWQVVGTFTDDGVSATHNKPEQRAGWQALLGSPIKYDAVVIWKVDRLARRVLDFLHADEALQARKAGIVAVDDPVDMTTAQGRAFATVLAVFGELEAQTISTRVAAARTHLLKAGRVVGGTVPYGWQNVRNPNGAGMVLAQDPERIDYVRGAAERARRGDSIYSIQQWLIEAAAPTPTGRGSWVYSTVERLLRHPVLAGMTPFNPGNDTKERGTEVLRDVNGLPVVDESLAIMSVAEWRAMVRALDERDSAQSLPRAMTKKTSGLLSGLVWCRPCEARMHRSNVNGREGYSCPTCHQTISNFEQLVVDHFLLMKGERVRWRRVEELHEGGAALLPEIEHRLDELEGLIRNAASREQRQELQSEQSALLDLRDEKRAEAPRVVLREVGEQGLFADAWAAATDVQAQRGVLDDAVARIWVDRGRPGRRTQAQLLARITFDWKMPEDLGPLPEPEDAAAAYGLT